VLGTGHISDGNPPPVRGCRLVGSGPLWLRGCYQVESAYLSGEWVARSVSAVCGKLAVSAGDSQRPQSSGTLRVIEAGRGGGVAPAVRLRSELLDGAAVWWWSACRSAAPRLRPEVS